jgi:membrane protease YdiL (CAAX protease family)
MDRVGTNRLHRLSREARWRIFDFIAVVLTGIGQLVIAAHLGLHGPFIAGASVLWLTYVLLRTRGNPDLWRKWGFAKAGFATSIRLAALPFAVGITFSVGFGLLAGTAELNWHIVPLLALYPLWGLVQQFLILALVCGNLVAMGKTMAKGSVPEGIAVLVTAILFASVHSPNLPLMAATFLMGMVTASVYLKSNNIWFAGLFHGWFATVFYYFALGTDPWPRLVEIIAAS